MLRGYERGARHRAALHQFARSLVFFATLGADRSICSCMIPKGFFPQQDTGLITGDLRSRAGHLLRRDDAPPGGARRDRDGTIPPSPPIAMSIGGRRPQPVNNGRMFITLKPRERARCLGAARSSPGCVRSSRRCRGRPPLHAGGAGRPASAAAPSRTQFEFTLQDADLDELNDWAPKILDKLKTLPQLRDVATDQQTDGTTLDAQDRPRHRRRASASSRS